MNYGAEHWHPLWGGGHPFGWGENSLGRDLAAHLQVPMPQAQGEQLQQQEPSL